MTIKIKSISEIDDFQKLTLTDFSYSRIDTYEMCRAKYFYSYIKREPRQFGEAAALGNIVHAVLEDLVSNEKPLELDEMHESYDAKRGQYDPSGLISDELILAGSNIINEFYDENEGKLFDVFEKEMPFNFIIGNYSIIGYIDRVDIDGDNVHIVDYKTGKREVAQKNIADNLQLGIYALAASTMFPRKKHKGISTLLKIWKIKVS